MNKRLRRLAYRVKKILEDGGQESMEIMQFSADHPTSMMIILKRLKKENEKAMMEIEPLLGPGDKSEI